MKTVLFMVLLAGGILFLVAGLFLTRSTWRSDVPPFGRRHRLFQIALHPELYARADRLGPIRALNLIGGVLLCGALTVVGIDVFAAMTRR